jgi:hypothetical protein
VKINLTVFFKEISLHFAKDKNHKAVTALYPNAEILAQHARTHARTARKGTASDHIFAYFIPRNIE